MVCYELFTVMNLQQLEPVWNADDISAMYPSARFTKKKKTDVRNGDIFRLCILYDIADAIMTFFRVEPNIAEFGDISAIYTISLVEYIYGIQYAQFSRLARVTMYISIFR